MLCMNCEKIKTKLEVRGILRLIHHWQKKSKLNFEDTKFSNYKLSQFKEFSLMTNLQSLSLCLSVKLQDEYWRHCHQRNPFFETNCFKLFSVIALQWFQYADLWLTLSHIQQICSRRHSKHTRKNYGYVLLKKV